MLPLGIESSFLTHPSTANRSRSPSPHRERERARARSLDRSLDLRLTEPVEQWVDDPARVEAVSLSLLGSANRGGPTGGTVLRESRGRQAERLTHRSSQAMQTSTLRRPPPGLGSGGLDSVLPSFSADKTDRARRRMDAMNDKEADSLSQAKDRGQVTMTSAMSITNVALLKAVLDRGPENNRFYVVTLVFICLALALQILAGLLSLCVSQLRSFYQKFNDDAGAYMYWCPMTCRWRGKDNAACWPCGYVVEKYTDAERHVVESWKDWVERDTAQDVAAAEADVMLEYLNGVTQKAREQLELLEERKDPSVNTEEYQAKRREVYAKIEDAMRRKRRYVDDKCAADTGNAQGEILASRMHEVMRNHVLKRAQSWQHVINYLLYAAFIINAFLTGFGIAS